MDRISVIIPVYNAEQTLDACIHSVLEQTHRNFELILVNDGSQDHSGAMCDQFSTEDSRVRVFHQKNAGVSNARNRGLACACGEYLTFLDADDIIPLNYLQILYDACQDADIAVCDVVSIQDGVEKKRFTHPEGMLSQTEALNLLLERRRINSGPCAKLIRRRVLEEVRFSSMKAYEDILFVRDAFSRAERIAVTARTEYRYIQNPHGAMSSFFKNPSQDIVRATEMLLEFIKERKDLRPETLYITASHLMQYVIPLAGSSKAGAKAFVAAAKAVYHQNVWEILRCPAFPWKEKIVFVLFANGWLYTDRKMLRVP